MVGPNDTSGYTLSLFDLAGGEPAKRTWGDLLRAVDGTEAAWRRELDSRFLQALDEQLFPPIEGRMRAGASRGEIGSTVRSSTASSAGLRSGQCRTMPPRPTGGPAR